MDEVVEQDLGGGFMDIHCTSFSAFLCISIFHNKMLDKMLSHRKQKTGYYLSNFLSH